MAIRFHRKTVFPGVIGLLGWILLIFAQPETAYSAGKENSLPATSTGGSEFSVSFKSLDYTGSIDQPVEIQVSITPDTPPPGQFYSILADVFQKPDGARVNIISGKQSIRMSGDRKGSYRLRIKVNVLGKSSCGGIEHEEIAVQAVDIRLD